MFFNMLKIFIFLLGMCIGSFLNVVIYRLPLHMNFIMGRSYCPKCHHQLSFKDLIPILSWVLLNGRCRYCHESISIRYPIIECLSGLLALFCFSKFGLTLMSIFTFIVACLFIIITMIDYDTMLIPDSLIICCLILSLFSLCMTSYSIMDRMIAFLIISLPMFLMNMIVESFGGGDIKLIAVCGIMLGTINTVIAMIIAIFLASFYSLFSILLRHKKVKDYIAFGPFLCLGIYLSLIYGHQILQYYFYIS